LYDNNIYRKLIGKDEKQFSKNLFKSLNDSIPNFYDRFYGLYFPLGLFLEAIGQGNFREKHAKNLDLTPFLLKMSELDQVDLEQKLLNLEKLAYDFFYFHNELSKESLLKKIDHQLKYCSLEDPYYILADSLVDYRNKIATDFEFIRSSLANYLSWDLICGFPFARLSEISEKDQELVRAKIRKINEWLLNRFHMEHLYKNRSFHRLADKIQKELLTTKSYIKKIEGENENTKLKILVPNMLESEYKDLGDIDYIDFATLGIDQMAGIILTGDSFEVVEDRLIIQLSLLNWLCEAEGSELKLFLGEIYIIDCKTGYIKEKILVSDIGKDARIKVNISNLHCGKSSILHFNK
jgi:hypothetical protein